MMQRHTDWPDRLAAFLKACPPFAWGRCDCALFACNAVRAITGVDMAAGFRGRYRSPLGAVRQISASCGGKSIEDLAEAMARNLDIEEIPPAYAQRGDVVLVDSVIEGRPMPTLAVHAGEALAVVAPEGLALLPPTRARRAWKIGR